MSNVKKIAFGFNKTSKKVEKFKPVQEKIQLIECLEGQSIKIIGSNEDDDKDKLLVIPLIPNRKILPSKPFNPEFEDIAEPNVVTKSNPENTISENNAISKQESLEVQAANEIIAELNKSNGKENENKIDSIPVTNEKQLEDVGEKESSTMEDYENIPINSFGMAMLRGMGWKAPANTKKDIPPHLDAPVPRPKGMGLGADRPSKAVSNGKVTKKTNEKGEELKIIIGGHVKVVMGKNANTYGQIEGFDDDSGRIIVKMAIGGAIVSLNEFMVEPVSKAEYIEKSKVLNSAKYDEYKNKERTKHLNYEKSHLSNDEQQEIKDIDSTSKKYKENTYVSSKKGNNSRSNSRSPDVYIVNRKDRTVTIDSSDEDEQKYKNKERRKSVERDRKSRRDNDDRYSSRKKDKKSSHRYKDESLTPSPRRRENEVKYRKDRSSSVDSISPSRNRRNKSTSPDYRRQTERYSHNKRDRTDKYKKEKSMSPESSKRKKDKKYRKDRSISPDYKDGGRYRSKSKERSSKSDSRKHKKKNKRKSRSRSRNER